MGDHGNDIVNALKAAGITPGSLFWVSAFTCQPIAHASTPLSPHAASTCQAQLVKPSSRLIFTPWVFRLRTRTTMNA
jgi:hypothetical protein